MHVYYKFGLLLIFLLSVSISYTAPAENSENGKSKSFDDDYYDYDDDDDYNESNSPEIAANRQSDSTSSTTTTTFRPIFTIPRRSSHVLEPSCPRSCLCLEDFKYVQCINAQLTHVPLDLPKTAAIVDLSHNDIAELRAEDFSGLAKLVEINLSYNLLKQVDKEVFNGLDRLRRLRLTNNHLTTIDPDTFAGATDLALLDLSNNTIVQRTDGSLLNQPSLTEFTCFNCNWTGLPEQIFSNLSGLTSLRLDNNDFKRQIDTKAFTPLKNIVKLKLPELNQTKIEELCQLLNTIDIISFKHFDISCFERVLGKSFNDSIIWATDSPTSKLATALPSTPKPTALLPPRTAANRKPHNKHMASNETTATVAKAGIMTETEISTSKDTESSSNQVAIDPETINTLLICIIVLAVVGIAVGLICRKDIGGIKTKCCRTSKPEPKDQVHPTEEIPLNKLA
ncbi:leucine-rich repeat and transmembrane domain-containing protein 2 isoform X1 [Drosophila nasuta]|uniref:leucine-rich repeat and transmembrane domain-containing protein 2 isoform X1 n=1 Tax=Drosophila nasuta TaxID=42062 RepID=UPI00295E550D|nr:leucine-rich repeat and transmembrane domain-containing protein 2 isoform X1 [Drosophila nasuta]XP_060651714.1 leucine-rich repeat and transmembrane domain-containing protein 2 isoform X1 [Drosophila nasuta]